MGNLEAKEYFDEHFERTPHVRPVFEALLIDETTPDSVYADLFGVSMEFVSRYKQLNSGSWDKPRMVLFAEIQRIRDSKARDLAQKVFDGGWEQIDALFNQGRNINAADSALKIVKIAAAKASVEALTSKKLPIQLINAAKSMVAASAQHSMIEGAGRDEAWEMLVEELQEKEASRILPAHVQDAYEQITQRLKDKIPEKLKNEKEKED